jgi:hypothetical protein
VNAPILVFLIVASIIYSIYRCLAFLSWSCM